MTKKNMVSSSNKLNKRTVLQAVAMPSTFFFFYWIIAVVGSISSIEYLSDLMYDAGFPEVTPEQVKWNREYYFDKKRLSDEEIAQLINNIQHDSKYFSRVPLLPVSQAILCLVSVTALGILIVRSVGGL